MKNSSYIDREFTVLSNIKFIITEYPTYSFRMYLTSYPMIEWIKEETLRNGIKVTHIGTTFEIIIIL